MGEVKTALVLIAAGSVGAVARKETDELETARVRGGHGDEMPHLLGGGLVEHERERNVTERAGWEKKTNKFILEMCCKRKDFFVSGSPCITQAELPPDLM